MTPRNPTSVITPYALTAVYLLDVCPARLGSSSATLITPKPSTFRTVTHLSPASSLPTSTLATPASQRLIRRNGLSKTP